VKSQLKLKGNHWLVSIEHQSVWMPILLMTKLLSVKKVDSFSFLQSSMPGQQILGPGIYTLEKRHEKLHCWLKAATSCSDWLISVTDQIRL
jgi:hypothetical protein